MRTMSIKGWLKGALSTLVAASFLVAAPMTASAEDGKTLFKKAKCEKCHSVTSEGIESTKDADGDAPSDLSGFGKKGVAKDTLKQYLLKEADINGKKHKKKVKMEDAELDTLATWLNGLK
jgi:cytochrome c peroxidase